MQRLAPTTFDGLDNWSILALADATLLGGTIHLVRKAEDDNMSADSAYLNATVDGFSATYAGPAAELPPVPEPTQTAMLLTALIAAALLRTWARQRSPANDAQLLPCS